MKQAPVLDIQINKRQEKKNFLKLLPKTSPKRLQMISLKGTEHFFQREFCWINRIRFTLKTSETGLTSGSIAGMLWGQ